MKKFLRVAIQCLVVVMFGVSCGSRNIDRQIDNKVDKLLKNMSYEQKIGQLSQVVADTIDDDLRALIREGRVGSVLIVKKNIFGAKERNALQNVAVEQSTLGIPIIFGHDVIHGYRTIFPLSLAQSATWDTLLVRRAARVAAREASAGGVDWTFAPMVDVSRDARWGRIAECFGEDAHLNASFGAASVRGYQGENVNDEQSVVACLKHFAGYGAAMGGRDYQYTEISQRTMHECYLPPFEAGIDAGALTVMSAFNDISGTPATANKRYVTNIMKGRWGFEGFVVSDWDAIPQLINHGIARDSLDAIRKAFDAGIDMEMRSGILLNTPRGEIANKRINDAVRRVLTVKYKKGLFDNPYTDESREQKQMLTAEHRALAREIASASMVLLENKGGVLPIEPTQGEKIKIAVLGDFAKEQELMGWWKSNGRKEEVVSPFSGLVANAPEGVEIVDKITADCDYIIACVGEDYNMFGENNNRSDIDLPNGQSEFIESLKKHNKPIVSVLFNGRPLTLEREKQNSDALLIAWHPGSEAGNALADLIFGKVNPSAKLTTSFPRKVGHIPTYYNKRNSGRPNNDRYFKGEKPDALYPFGYGLSYTTFEYSDIQISKKEIKAGGNIEISAMIRNTGSRKGQEVVQLYLQDVIGSTTRPIKELRAFAKVRLEAGESKRVSFTLDTSCMMVLNEDMHPIAEKGEFRVWIAPNSRDLRLREVFYLK